MNINLIVFTSLLMSWLRQETVNGPFGLRVNQPIGLSPQSGGFTLFRFNAERQEGKL